MFLQNFANILTPLAFVELIICDIIALFSRVLIEIRTNLILYGAMHVQSIVI